MLRRSVDASDVAPLDQEQRCPAGVAAVPFFAMHGIVKRWRDVTVLDHLDLQLRRGTITRVVGANGAGKTTLIRVAAGFIRPEAGSVSFNGFDPHRDRRRYYEKLGLLTAGGAGLYARLTVRQTLEFVAAIALLDGARHRAAVDTAVDRFDLRDLVDRRADRLSMGQRQRLRLATTFMNEPDVVLLDEPRTSLDDHGLKLVSDALVALAARGGAALWCSPSGEAELISDETYVLRDGRIHPS